MILTVLLPDGSQAELAIADATLVYDGQQFLNPENAYYVALYSVPVEAVSTEYRGFTEDLTAYQSWKCSVVNRDPQTVVDTDPRAIVQPDPALGECICGITCQGTEIRYAQVHIMEA